MERRNWTVRWCENPTLLKSWIQFTFFKKNKIWACLIWIEQLSHVCEYGYKAWVVERCLVDRNFYDFEANFDPQKSSFTTLWTRWRPSTESFFSVSHRRLIRWFCFRFRSGNRWILSSKKGQDWYAANSIFRCENLRDANSNHSPWFCLNWRVRGTGSRCSGYADRTHHSRTKILQSLDSSS